MQEYERENCIFVTCVVQLQYGDWHMKTPWDGGEVMLPRQHPDCEADYPRSKQYLAFLVKCSSANDVLDSKVYGTDMGPIWGRQDTGGPHVGPMNFAIWVILCNL